MSRLLRPSQPTSYFALPQDSHIDDDDNDSGKETSRSLQRPEKRQSCSHWSQLAMTVVLLSLAGTTGFFIGLSFPHKRLTFPSLLDTVPQGLQSSIISQMPSTDLTLVTIGLSRETFQYNESFAAPPPRQGGEEPVWDSLIPSKLKRHVSLYQDHG